MVLIQQGKTRKIILSLVCLMGTMWGSLAQAIPLFPVNQDDFYLSLSPNSGTYNATTHLFHVTLDSARGYTSAHPFNPSASITGPLVLDAIIDNTGSLSSGTVSWYGGSSDLGIADNTALIVGEINGFKFFKDEQFQFQIEGRYAPKLGINPQKDIGLALDDIPSNLGAPRFGYYEGYDIFKSDFTLKPYSNSYMVTVAEPSSVALLGLGVLALFGMTGRRRV